MQKKYNLVAGLLLSFVLVGNSWAIYCPLGDCVNETVETTWYDEMADHGFDVGLDRDIDTTVEIFFSHNNYYDRTFVTIGDWWNTGRYYGREGDLELMVRWCGINDLRNYGKLDVKRLTLPGWCDYFKPKGVVITTADSKPILEPATMLLLGTGLAGLAGWRRKNKKQTLLENDR